MQTTQRTTKAGVIRRDIEVNRYNAGPALAHVTEIKGDIITVDLYWLRRMPSDFGVYIAVEKGETGEVHDVLLNAPGGGHTCTCKWGTYKGHTKPCRHIETALLACKEQKI
jgi:hypothetical protein